jgi:predicted nucleotide-binding protein (sugar kinase/HSP70/actin superfamily)
LKLPVNMYFAHMFGGFLRKMGCTIRPYECQAGQTDTVIEESLGLFESAFAGEISKESAVASVVEKFKTVETHLENRCKVAVFGDFYVRDNCVLNQDLIHFVEKHGGEVVTTPYSTLGKMIVGPYMRKWLIEGNVLGALSTKALIATVSQLEKTYLKYFEQILGPQLEVFRNQPEDILGPFGLRIEHTGESMENLLKIFYIKKYHKDVSLFVQVNPAFCCPSLVTEGMGKEIEKWTGVPILSITYDGTGGNKNEAIIPYLTFERKPKSGELDKKLLQDEKPGMKLPWRFGRTASDEQSIKTIKLVVADE